MASEEKQSPQLTVKSKWAKSDPTSKSPFDVGDWDAPDPKQFKLPPEEEEEEGQDDLAGDWETYEKEPNSGFDTLQSLPKGKLLKAHDKITGDVYAIDPKDFNHLHMSRQLKSLWVYSADGIMRDYTTEGRIQDISNHKEANYLGLKITSLSPPFDIRRTTTKSEEKEEAPVKVDFGTRKPVSFNEIDFLIQNPVLYFSGERPKLRVSNELLECCLLEPDQFDEKFSVEEDVPESPLMKKFLTRKAELINEELSKDDDLEEEDLSKIEKQAYKDADYQNKSFETVHSEAKDYHKYLRFLLTKGDNIVITKDEKDWFDKFKNLVNDGLINAWIPKFGKRKLKVEMMATTNNEHYHSDVISYIATTAETSTIYAFMVIPAGFSEPLEKLVETTGVSSKLGYLSTLFVNSGAKGCKRPLDARIVIADTNFNYTMIRVKCATIKKWMKNMEVFITELDGYMTNTVGTTWGLNNKSVIEI